MIGIDKKSIAGLKSLYQKECNSVVITHINPDGDTIGSGLALYHILKKNGHSVRLISPDRYPDFLSWLPGNDDVLVYNDNKEEAIQTIKDADLITCIDFNTLQRTGELEPFLKKSGAKKVLIDHHPNPEDFADFTISTIHVSSAAELLYALLKELQFEQIIDINVATCLFTGLMTDTGSFNFATENPETFITAAELLKYGINTDEIHSKVYHNYSFDRQQLMGYALSQKLKYLPELNTAFISLSKKELTDFNHQVGDTEGFVNIPLQIKNLKFSALFIEKDDEVKISFRSKEGFSSSEFAKMHFNGGGHKKAAGGHAYNLTLDETLKKFSTVLLRYKDQLSNND